jgi:hypothetical protein
MYLSEYFAWAGGGVVLLVNAFYMIFGKVDHEHKYKKVFGIKSNILGNKSAVIPKKVLIYTFSSSGVLLSTATLLYILGY